MPAAYINDGYTELATIAGVPATFPAVRVCFRPETAAEFGEFALRLELSNAVEARRITAEFLAAKLVDWDLRNANGTRVEICAKSILELHEVFIRRLWQVVLFVNSSTLLPVDPSQPREAREQCKAEHDGTNDDLANLVAGVRLELVAPHFAGRDCRHCEKYIYDEATGLPTKHRRPPGTFARCRYSADGCPKGTPETSRALSDKNRRAYRHYRMCQAVGRFPHDALVERNAALIRSVEEQWAR